MKNFSIFPFDPLSKPTLRNIRKKLEKNLFHFPTSNIREGEELPSFRAEERGRPKESKKIANY
jgi:hypothetical protein